MLKPLLHARGLQFVDPPPPPAKPDPRNHSTIVGIRSVVACQIEAYIFALNAYVDVGAQVLDVVRHGRAEWHFLDGPFKGPFHTRVTVGSDNLTLSLFLRKIPARV